MRHQLLLSLVILSFSCATIICHTVLVGVDGSRSCVRVAPSNFPLGDLSSNEMRCYGRNSPAGSRCAVRAGSEVTLKWQHEINGASIANGVIDPSHKGPITVYLASADSQGNGNSWFKIAQEGYANGRWAVDKLIDAKGNWNVRIPANLKSGNYILRAEIIALHEAFRDNGAQFYTGCADITVTGGGSGDCGPKVSIPGNWIPNNQNPGVKFDMYRGAAYPIPGPAIASCSGGSGNVPAPEPTPRTGGQGSSGSSLTNGRVYYLKPLSNPNLCLDAAGQGDGDNILVVNCHNTNNQKWKLENAGNGWKLTEQRSGKSLDGWGTGTGVQLWSFGGGANQKWAAHHTSSAYVFKNTQSNEVLTAGAASGTKASQSDSHGGNNQKWRLVPA